MRVTSVLLASHGTVGAIAAERTALEVCAREGAKLYHFVVVPDFWKGMTGDDWLNNAASQIRFGRHVENILLREIVEHAERLAREAARADIPFDHSFALGKPAECLVEKAAAGEYDLVIIGSPRPKGTPGYSSRMKTEPLVRNLMQPLLIVPFPTT